MNDAVSDLYDEIMARDPATRTDREEAFIEYVGGVRVTEVIGPDGTSIPSETNNVLLRFTPPPPGARSESD